MGAKTVLKDNEIDGHSIATVLGVSYPSFINNHALKISKMRHGAWNKLDAQSYINHVRRSWNKEPIDFDKVEGWNAVELVPVLSEKPEESSPCVIKAFRVEDIEGGVAISVKLSGYTAVEFLTHFSAMVNPVMNVEIGRERVAE